MSGMAIALATKGVICKGDGDVTLIVRRVMPFNLQLDTDPIKLSLDKQDVIALNTSVTTKKLVLRSLPQLKLTAKRVNKIKLTLKKCEN